jgi:hypothetical protein
MRLVAEAEQLVVVGEVHVPVECERSKVREVIEAVALKPGAKLQLKGEADGKEAAEEEPDTPSGGAGVTRDARADYGQPGEREDGRKGGNAGRVAGDVARDRTARDLASAELGDCGCQRRPGDGIQQPRPPGLSGLQGITLKMRSSGPFRSFVGENRATSRL